MARGAKKKERTRRQCTTTYIVATLCPETPFFFSVIHVQVACIVEQGNGDNCNCQRLGFGCGTCKGPLGRRRESNERRQDSRRNESLNSKVFILQRKQLLGIQDMLHLNSTVKV